MTNIQIFNYNGSSVPMTRNENGIVYVNLTEVAKAFPNKNLSTIVNSQEIKEYCESLSKLQNFSFADLLIVKKGAPNLGGYATTQMLAAA
ncbi:KilA-N domain-containing protein [Muribaculum intestinale]|uniref:KilA-N domain-containing protein n=1 Tax=Muribaculum intestinale TaxID=1796646 RepID=UPI0025B30B8E|nr:KilA-N domain-containing protein [Muribaculum intestinale]